MSQAKTAERAHGLVIAEVERSTRLYTDSHGRPLPAHDIAAGIVLKLVTDGLLRDDVADPAALALDPVGLANFIAATIRRVDGAHSMGTGQLAEYIASDLLAGLAES